MSKKTFSKIVSDSAKYLDVISSDQLNKLMKEDDNLVILDVSDKETVEDRGFVPGAVKENLEALIADIKKAKPASSKGQYLRNMTLTTTMGPGLKIDQSSLDI